jgi:ribosomal protein S14
MTYIEYLNQVYNRAWAARRKQLRKDKQPCQICGESVAEVTPEGFWLCRQHRVELNNMQPVWTVFQKLERLGIEPASEADFLAGKVKIKKVKPKKIRFIVAYKTSIWEYNAGSRGTKK